MKECPECYGFGTTEAYRELAQRVSDLWSNFYLAYWRDIPLMFVELAALNEHLATRCLLRAAGLPPWWGTCQHCRGTGQVEQ